MSQPIQVVAAVIYNPQGQIFIAKRPLHKHQGGLWEFPGGKLEAGEPAKAALERELFEELGIKVTACMPLIQICHDYQDQQVDLDVWQVTEFSGVAHGREGQQVRWVSLAEIHNYSFPDANKAILARLLEKSSQGISE